MTDYNSIREQILSLKANLSELSGYPVQLNSQLTLILDQLDSLGLVSEDGSGNSDISLMVSKLSLIEEALIAAVECVEPRIGDIIVKCDSRNVTTRGEMTLVNVDKSISDVDLYPDTLHRYVNDFDSPIYYLPTDRFQLPVAVGDMLYGYSSGDDGTPRINGVNVNTGEMVLDDVELTVTADEYSASFPSPSEFYLNGTELELKFGTQRYRIDTGNNTIFSLPNIPAADAFISITHHEYGLLGKNYQAGKWYLLDNNFENPKDLPNDAGIHLLYSVTKLAQFGDIYLDPYGRAYDKDLVLIPNIISVQHWDYSNVAYTSNGEKLFFNSRNQNTGKFQLIVITKGIGTVNVANRSRICSFARVE